MIIREAKEADLDRIADIAVRCFTDPWTRQGFADTMTQSSALLLAAEDVGKVIGYCCLYQVLDEGEIVSVGIDPEFRMQGYGAHMVSELMKLGMDHGVCRYFLEVREGNKAGRSLYKSLGFGEDGIRKGFYEHPKEDAVLMSWCKEGNIC